MSGAEVSIAGVERRLEELRAAAVGAGAVELVADLDKIARATASLADQLATLPSRASAAGDDVDELRTIRHDLRTPVGQIIGYCELLQEEAEDEVDSRWHAPLRALGAYAVRLRGEVDQAAAAYTGPASDDTGMHRSVSVIPAGGGVERADESEAPGTILVVDDNEENRLLLQRRLERDGYRVLAVGGGEEALAAAAASDVDVVLLDILMPVVDGYETLARLKADPELRHIPVIMLTSLEEAASISACIEAGAEDHLPKPFDPVLLRARLSGSLEKKRARDRERRYLDRIVAEKDRADALIHGVIPIGVALSTERNEARILERTLAEARRFCGADGGVLILRDGDHLSVVHLQCDSLGLPLEGSPTPSATRAAIDVKDGRHASRPDVVAALEGKTVAVPSLADAVGHDLSVHRAFDQEHGYRTRSLVCVPLRPSADAEPCGVLELWNATRPTDGAPIGFAPSIVEVLLSLSSLAAAALVAYRRERELRRRIRRLEIRIDETERTAEVEQITETDYFKRLRQQARKLRGTRSDG